METHRLSWNDAIKAISNESIGGFQGGLHR